MKIGVVLEEVFKRIIATKPRILTKVTKTVETTKEGFEQVKWISGMEEVGIVVKIIRSMIEPLMPMMIVL